MKPVELTGANVAITGAARGIGLATAKAFAAEGATVWIGDLDGAAAAAAAAVLGVHGCALDVRSKTSWTEFLAHVDGPLDVLVNNAGIMPLGRFLDEGDTVTEAVLDINTLGMIWGMKIALPGMLERGHGHVINVASYMGKVPLAGAATYVASKHAVVGLTEAVRDELHGTGVSVTAVLPSAVRTDLVAGVQTGGILPTVDPERIATGIVESCRKRPAILAIPHWMRLYEFATVLIPDRVVAGIRGRVARKRAINDLDSSARADYDAHIRGLADH